MHVALLIIFISSLIRSTIGFGDALLAMPLLTIVLGIETATPLVALTASTIAMTITLASWRKIDINAAWQLVLGSFFGIPLGILMLKIAPKALVIDVFAVFLILFGFYRLFRLNLPTLKGKNWAYLFGFIAGSFGSAYNTNGPFVVLYGTIRKWSPDKFRATLQGYFLLTGLLIVIGHGFSGMWNHEVIMLYLMSLPVVFTAIFIGEKLNQRIPTNHFERILFIVFIFLGILLLAQSR